MALSAPALLDANATNSSSKPELHLKHQAMFFMWLGIVLTGNFLGGIASIIIAVTTLAYKPLRSCSSSALIAHCTILDAIRSLVVYPMLSLLAFLAPYHDFPGSTCRYIGGAAYILVYTNYWAYCCLAVNRFVAAVFPHSYRSFTTLPAKVIINLIPWFLSSILVTFPFFKIGVNFTYTTPWSACIIGPSRSSASGVLLALGTCFPCAICGLCYVTLLIRVRMTRRRAVNPAGLLGNVGNIQRRYDISRILFFGFLWTFSSLLLFACIISWFPALMENYPLQTWLRLPQFLSSAFNPVVFLLVSGVYRAGVRAVLTGTACQSQNDHVEINAGPRFVEMYSNRAVFHGISTERRSSLQGVTFPTHSTLVNSSSCKH